jgi:selenocysteine lyase/cysteine desulfurase
MNRRSMLRAAVVLGGAGVLLHEKIGFVQSALAARAGVSPDELAADEDFWQVVRQAYSLDAAYLMLNADANNVPPRTVHEAHVRSLEMVSSAPFINSRRTGISGQGERVRQRLARLANVSVEEIALTRNTTEGLNIVISGMKLSAGDELICTDHDYPVVHAALAQRAARDGIVVRKVELPILPKSTDALVDCYRRAVSPKTKAVVVSHIVDGVMQLMPVRQIAALARQAGARVIVDGALAFGQIPVDIAAIGCDYYATSLHKWLAAPLGTGMLYVRAPVIEETWPLLADSNQQERTNIRKFEAIGTHSHAEKAAVGQAIDFYESIGPERKAARLRYLKNYWATQLKGEPRIRFGVSLAPEHSAASIHIGIDGIEGGALSRWMIEKKRIWVYGPIRSSAVDGVYVAPNLYTRLSELDLFVAAMREAARTGIAT